MQRLLEVQREQPPALRELAVLQLLCAADVPQRALARLKTSHEVTRACGQRNLTCSSVMVDNTIH